MSDIAFEDRITCLVVRSNKVRHAIGEQDHDAVVRGIITEMHLFRV